MLLKNLTFGSDVSASGWKRASNGTRMAYDFTYDGLHRLKDAVYKEGSSVNNRYTEKVTGYVTNGSITRQQQYARTGASSTEIVDNLTFTRTGNEIDFPQTVTFSNGSTIIYYYAADGTKFCKICL